MIQMGEKQRALLTLLLILLLVFGVICLTTSNSPVDLLAPALLFLFVLLLDSTPAIPIWPEQVALSLTRYLASAPDRAPPLSL